MKKRENRLRFTIVGILFAAVCMVYTGRLIYLQVAGQDYYTMSKPTAYVTRTVPIQAYRGEIYDTNGVPLVTNRYSYDLQLDYGSFPSADEEQNRLLLGLLQVAEKHSTEPTSTGSMPFVCEEMAGGISVSFREDFFASGSVRYRRFAALIDGMKVKNTKGESSSLLVLGLGTQSYTGDSAENARVAAEAIDKLPAADRCAWALMERYGLIAYENSADKTGSLVYTPAETVTLLLRRLDMELADFSIAAPYTLFEKISLELVSHAEESFSRGIRVHIDAAREYQYPGYASHILGRVGKIQGNTEYYTSQGYSMDAIVGLDGVEAAFEEYLRGIDGVLTITEDTYGNIVKTEITTEPVAGNNVYLTIDIGMQMAAELALAENIQQIREEADPDNPLSGEDASKGALVATDVNTGAVLAMASYPTYNLATFQRDFPILNADEDSPMLNRALQGTYAPGSTFKVGVAVEALDAAVIEADTVIDAQGQYTFYSDYQPKCWVYAYDKVHGEINVIEAIQESCNYFFFEVGRILGIDKINERMQSLGLGQPTGIELYEKIGILASPSYRIEKGLDKWTPGDTLQAAIGQSDNAFTPLQLCVYTTTLLNRGVRYSAYILDRVSTYSGEILYSTEPEILDNSTFSKDIHSIIMEGMKNVMDNGSAARIFAGYPITVGGKTGTAQVYKTKSDNAIMTAFAPYENPKIAVTCVIEQGYSGTKAGYSIKDVFDYYFDLD